MYTCKSGSWAAAETRPKTAGAVKPITAGGIAIENALTVARIELRVQRVSCQPSESDWLKLDSVVLNVLGVSVVCFLCIQHGVFRTRKEKHVVHRARLASLVVQTDFLHPCGLPGSLMTLQKA
jgi:hypothetical protein